MRLLRVASLTLLVLVVPLLAYAQSTSSIQQQVEALLAQVATLNAQLQQSTTATPVQSAPAPISPTPSSSVTCPVFNSPLSRGNTGAAVIALQQFLVNEGFLTSDSVTGFYGPITESAVRDLQAQQNIVSSGNPVTTGWGVVGPQTSAIIVRLCSASAAPAPTVTPSAPSCLQVSPPTSSCTNGWQPVDGAEGCVMYYQCTTAPITTDEPSSASMTSPATSTGCPVVQQPVCSGTVTPFQTNANGCVVSYQCSI